MPDQPTWLERVPEILAELNGPAAPPFLDRAAVELLFGLRRRQAIALMHHMAGYQAGRTFLAERADVIRFLSQSAVQEAAHSAIERKRRVVEHLAAARRDWAARKIRIPLDSSPPQPGQLPPGVELRSGQLTIRFDQPLELLQKLFDLSRTLASDFDRLIRECGCDPPDREQDPGSAPG